MKNVNQQELNELSQQEVVQIEGGNLLDSLKTAANTVIDTVNGAISSTGYSISHWN